MTQLELFTQSETDDQSYPVVIPANPLVKPGSAEAVKMTDTSGQKYFPLFSKSDQIGSFVKTFLATSRWASTRCFLTWQTKPITQSKHFILELSASMPDIDVCDFGSSQEMWPTPTSSTGGPSKNPNNPRGEHGGNPLATAVAMWPTPRARDWKMTGDVANWAESAIGDECLRRAVGRKEATPGSLNPQWVEWLMGYPEGWTDLKD